MLASSLKERRAALCSDGALRGAAFGRELASLLDRTLVEIHAASPVRAVSVVALGSYGRRELCPGSDVDVLLLFGGRGRERDDVRALAERLWYPLWDAGLVTGHAARTVKQTLAVADDDLDALTALLEVRHVAGDPSLTGELESRGRQLARKRQRRALEALAAAAEVRRIHPGPVAEMLEPDLKQGAGGLRDIQALEWAGWMLGEPGGLTTLAGRGFVTERDVDRLRVARFRLLELRVELHRVTGGRSDLLVLQEQDAVAARLGHVDADTMVREMAAVAREVAWVARDAWSRVRASIAGPSGRVARRDHVLAEHVVLRDGRVTLTDSAPVDALTVLEAAAAAAESDAPFDRATLERLPEMAEPDWSVWQRAALLRLLRTGDRAIPVFEALDHEGVLVRLLPEWEHVRSRPQRNAYHRFTVDRHLLEAVAECARLLDAGDRGDAGLDAVVARACRRPELLLLGALLHDVGKGMDGDHSRAGAEVADAFARRIRLDSEGREVLGWLVRLHLLMADVATRRDLADAAVAESIADACAGDPERLRLLYLLTIGDSRATGPAAWSASKAALVADLFVKAAATIERGAPAALAADRRRALGERIGAAVAERFLARMPEAYLLAFDDETMAAHRELLSERSVSVSCDLASESRVGVTVVAPDRPGLLATIAGALTMCGLAVQEANLFSTADGMALDVLRTSDPYGRVAERGAGDVVTLLRRALDGDLDVAAGVAGRTRDYGRRGPAGPVVVEFDLEASDHATVVEVHADDEIGLLFRIADTFGSLGIDVRVAKVATLGERVVDVFYVRDAAGHKIVDPDSLEALRAALAARLAPTGPHGS